MAKKIVTDDGEIIDAPVASSYSGPLFFKTPWNHDTDLESARLGFFDDEPTKTQQHLAKETEISEILRKFTLTGQVEQRQAQYMDIEEEFDLQNKMVTGWQVQEAWEALPAAVRNILKEPKVFVDYVEHCLDTGDLDPLRELGLAKAIQTPPAGSATATPAPSSSPAGTPAAGGESAAPAANKPA